MFEKMYYTLVAGLKDYFLDSDTKGFDAPAIIEEVKEGVSGRDRKAVELLYAYYDIENIVAMRAGRSQFSALGNYTREELEEQLASPTELPKWMGHVIEVYNSLDKESSEVDIDDDMNTEVALERNLFAAYYKECARSKAKFMRDWADFDRTLRNVSAAFAARRRNMSPGDVTVGEGDIVTSLSRSSAADFGLKGEVEYIDRIMAAIADNGNLIEKEQRVDAIRWETAEELTSMSYFDINYLLGYLVRINIIYRWATLDPERGREMLQRLIDSLTGSEVLGDMNGRTGVLARED